MKYIIFIFLFICLNVYSSTTYIAANGTCQTGQNIANNGGGTCNDTSSGGNQLYSITFNSCPKTTTAKLIIFPNFLSYPISIPSINTGFTLGILAAYQVGSCSTPSSGEQSCNAEVDVSLCQNSSSDTVAQCPTLTNAIAIPDGSYSQGASYMVTCN